MKYFVGLKLGFLYSIEGKKKPSRIMYTRKKKIKYLNTT